MNFLKKINSKKILTLANNIIIKDNVYSSYKSSISLENIYPKSNSTITTSKFKSEQTDAKFSGFIPMDKLNITYCKSSGPGGQNVNCVNTKVDLRFHLDSADWLPKQLRESIKEKNKNKISKDGFLVLRSEKTRFQQMNLADAVYNLRQLIWAACEPEPAEPAPETLEKIRRRQEKAIRNRLIEKRLRSDIKRDRKGVEIDL